MKSTNSSPSTLHNSLVHNQAEVKYSDNSNLHTNLPSYNISGINAEAH